MQKTDLSNYPRKLLAELFRRLVLVREFELRAIEERRAGLIPGFIHSCVGQEASAIGACLALEADDVITSTHRGHGHLIGKGGDPRYMMAELAARSPGYCCGRGGSLHIADFDLGILGPNGIVAGGIPSAVGAALAFSMRHERCVALSFFGDGAVKDAATRARAGEGPTFVEAKTYRYRGHYEGDPQVYRPPSEMEAWKARDPIPTFRQRLLQVEAWDEAALTEIEAGVQAQLDEAVAFAKAAPQPAEALQGAYADTHGGLVF